MEQSDKFKVVGIACDNYKVNKFKKTLTKKGFEILDVSKLDDNVQVIRVNCPVQDVYKLGQLIKSINVLFKRQN